MTTPPPPAGSPTAIPSPLASWGIRAQGFLIDYGPIIILNIVFFRSRGLFSLVGLLGIAYLVLLGYLDGMTGQTPGKAIMGTRLVDQQGNLLGSGAGIGRKFLHILDSLVCFLGWFLPIVDAKRQTIADKVMTSFVVEGMEKKPFALDLWMPPKNDQPPSQ